jgi:hypothetical protein
MKHLVTKALLATAGLALVAQSASANNTFTQGDLMLAFRESGFNDLILDIGPSTQYLTASSTINLDTVVAAAGNPTYTTLSSLVDHVFGSATGVTWSVMGALKSGSTTTDLFATDPGDITSPLGQSSINLASGDVTSYVSKYVTGTGANVLVANLAVQVPNPSGTSGSYTKEAPLIASAVGFGQEGSIPSTADFYDFTAGNSGTLENGYFQMNSDGSGAYVIPQAPEPSTYAMFGAGMLLLLMRQRIVRKQA